MSELGPVVFFGTPEFALPTLDALRRARLGPALVVTQPPRRAGRRGGTVEPPVAQYARDHGLDLAQPERVGAAPFLERLEGLGPDVAVVVAFGQIFPRRLLELPRLGCVNLHASLLPRHRGAAPVQAAIAAGDERTGVTTMLMDEGLDTGPILQTRAAPIGPRDTAGDLAPRLARLGAPLVVGTVRALARGELEPVAQDDAQATYAPRLARDDGRIDWALPARRIERLVRAYTPWPETFTSLRDESVKVLAAAMAPSEDQAATAGELVAITGEALRVGCGDGRCLDLLRLQRPGRRAVSGAELANGLRLAVGERFG